MVSAGGLTILFKHGNCNAVALRAGWWLPARDDSRVGQGKSKSCHGQTSRGWKFCPRIRWILWNQRIYYVHSVKKNLCGQA